MAAPHDVDDDEDEAEPVPVWKRGRVQLAAAAGLVVLAFIFSRGKAPTKPEEPKATDAYIGVVVPYQPPTAPPPAPILPPVKIAQSPPPVLTPPAPAPAPAPLSAPAPLPPPMPALSSMAKMPGAAAQKPARPVMLSFAVPHTDGPKPVTPPAEPPQTGLVFKTATIPGSKASPAIDDTYQLMPGLLPCVLDTAIQSDLPGPLLAHLPGPVYSPKGVLLMPAGTQIIGKYETLGKSGGRLMATSTYAHTPDGIWVPLSGEPLADDLGRTGLDGAVDNHYLQRFGAAILLSIGDGAMSILQAEVSKGGNTYLNLNQGSGIGGLAQQILQAQINIPPTFTKHQGETIALFLDQPIDFSASYRIRIAGDHPQ
jgi:type IV secretion system protein VirB10